MQRQRMSLAAKLVVAVTLFAAASAGAQVSVTVEKFIETGSDQTAVFDFPGVGMLGDGDSANYQFTGGISLVFEQPPADAGWLAPTINCITAGQVTAVVTGPFEVTVTDQSGGLSASSVTCTFTNRQAAVPPPTSALEVPVTGPVGLTILALLLVGAGIAMQRRIG